MNEELYKQFLNAGAMAMQREKYNSEIKKHKAKISDKNAEVFYLKAHIDDNPKPYSVKRGWATALFILSGLSLCFLPLSFEAEALLAIAIIIMLAACATFLGVCLLISAKRTKKASVIANTHKHEIAQRECEILTAQEEKEIARIEAESNKFWATYKPLIDFLPEKYQTLEAVAFMLESIKNLRAHTLTEVINLWEAELKDIERLSAMRSMAEAQRIQNERVMSALAAVQENQAALHSDLQTVKTMQAIDLMQNI